ncbi:MAG: hypothetical protein QXH35_07955 [Nitrososphaerota archaeon]
MVGKRYIHSSGRISGIEISDSDDRLVAGWANVQVVDMQGEIIPAEVLEKAMLKYMISGGPIMLARSNKQVGKVVRWEVEEHPEVKAHGLRIVAWIGNVYPLHDEV